MALKQVFCIKELTTNDHFPIFLHKNQILWDFVAADIGDARLRTAISMGHSCLVIFHVF